jgi:hypothetical protein
MNRPTTEFSCCELSWREMGDPISTQANQSNIENDASNVYPGAVAAPGLL